MAGFSDLFDESFNKSMKDIGENVKQVISDLGGKIKTNTAGGAAAVNIVETGNSFRVEILAPGFSKEQLKLSIEDGGLTIKGLRSEAGPAKGEQYLRNEFTLQAFERSFSLPKTIDITRLDASYRDGILYVTLHKKDEFIQHSGIDINIS